MNLPNKLTVFRVILIPFFVVFLLANIFGEADKWIAVGIFIVASLTDLADGKIARKYNLVTDFGKFMDPLADKLLVCSAMICLIELGRIPSWIVVIIIAREFIISGFRLIAVENGRVIAASYWGKFKTTFQMIMVILMIVNIPQLQLVTNIIMYIALALTIISLCDYIIKNKDVMSGDM
ncbi:MULTISPECIES: CDP-diacylglycerol--glycerol-3-phosphate 3-phosphatidyltransferase [unclassified Butyrivibrio]|uniref:CDP-diacylglycerol--glycerol-3-phosphate 3-phosphatidyltransferase n=1 Tax=unclassified Butyrivibrio TaxID=2639466 RepID=UPI00047AEA3C